MIGSTIRSAKMKAITPAKLRPPDHSTAASGTLPTEQTKLSTAMTGPMTAPHSVCTAAGASSRKRPLKKSSPSSAMKPASRKPVRISFHSICQSPRKLCATSDHACGRGQALAPWHVAADGVVLVAGVGLVARARARRPRRSGETNARSSSHMRAIITSPPRYSASVNCQPIRTHRTRPSSHTRLVEANWKASADVAEAPFWKRLFAIAMAA